MKLRNHLTGVVAGLGLCLSTAQADVMLGAFVAGNGWDTDSITELNEDLNGSLSYLNLFSSFSSDWDLLYWQSTHAKNANLVPMISWMPADLDRPDVNILPEIVLGTWDEYLDKWGNDLLAWVNSYPEGERPRMMIRFGHEFNGNWYPWGDSPEWYKAAYRHIHERFDESGVNQHVEWVWSASNTNVDSHNDMTVYYPGDTYVDWTSLDGYNWGSNYAWTQWESFSERFSDSYRTLVVNYPEKPILIAEVASAEPLELPDLQWGQNGDDSDRFEDKEQWTYEMLNAIETDFPAIRALTLFNVNKELGWALNDSANTGLQGFTTGMMSGHFTPDFLLAAPATPVVVSSSVSEPELQEPASSGKGNSKSKGKASNSNDRKSDKAQSTKQNMRSITAEAQRKLAQSKLPRKGDQVRRQQMRDGFMNMSPVARKHMKSWKLDVLNNN